MGDHDMVAATEKRTASLCAAYAREQTNIMLYLKYPGSQAIGLSPAWGQRYPAGHSVQRGSP